MGFTCSVCGEYHEERPLDLRYELPDAIHELPQHERTVRAEIDDDFCRLTEPGGRHRHYVRGLIEIPVAELDGYFGYGVWVEIAEDDFLTLIGTWHEPDAETLIEGQLANELEAYSGSRGLNVTLRNREELPEVLLRGHHALAYEQRSGIDEPRANVLSASILH